MMMLMIGDPPESNPKAHIQSPASHYLCQTSSDNFHCENAFAALQRYLPSNRDVAAEDGDEDSGEFEVPADAFSCDDFRMFEFKVKKCTRARPHDWTECPYAHPGEKARRRDPRRWHYSGCACPEFRIRGACSKGDSCEYAHGVFECWLHPARYRTQPCKDGIYCRRRICFFAHTPEQLRVLPCTVSPEASPIRLGPETFPAVGSFGSSPKSTSYSQPISPTAMAPAASINQLSKSLQGLQINRLQMSIGPPAWKPGFGSPRSPETTIRTGLSLTWEVCCEEEQAMERVESGRLLREKLYAKLGKENSLERVGRVYFPGTGPDVGWVSDLVSSNEPVGSGSRLI